MSDDIQITTNWQGGRLSVLVQHAGNSLYAGHGDPRDPEYRARVADHVCNANGFQEADYPLIGDQVERALEDAAKQEPERPQELIDLRQSHDPPPFCVDALPAWLGEWVLAWSARMEMAPEIAVGVAMGVFASILQRGSVVDVDDSWEGEPMSLWIMPLAPPSAGKTPVFKAATRELERIISEQMREWKLRHDEFASLARALDAKQNAAEKRFANAQDEGAALAARGDIAELARDKQEMEAPASPNWIMADATKESIRKKFDQTHGYAAVLDDEATFLNNTVGGRYAKSTSSDEMDTLRKAFNGQVLPTDRSGSDFGYNGPCYLTILQVVQPQVLATMQASAAAMGRGTFARFLMLWPSTDNIGSRTFEGAQVPVHVGQRFDSAVRGLMEQIAPHEGAPARLRLHHEANRMRLEFNRRYEGQRRDADPLIVEGDGKLFGSVVVRIAGMLHALDRGVQDRAEIDAATFARAIRIVEVFRAHLLKTIGGMRSDPRTEDAVAVVETMRRLLDGDVHRASAVRKRMKWNRGWSVHRTNEALALLESHNWITLDRKSGVIDTHPDFYVYENPQIPQIDA